MKPKRSVEHVVTDLFAFLGTYDYRDERRILALDSKGPEAFRTFYSSYLPLIVTLWSQALQYGQPGHADAVHRAFLDEVTARLYRLGAAKLAEDVLHGVSGLPRLLQRENGVVLVAAACVESMTGGNIPKKGKRANLLTQKILKILQFFISKLSTFEVVEISPVRATYVSMFFASTNGNGAQPEPPAPVQSAHRKGAQPAASTAQPAVSPAQPAVSPTQQSAPAAQPVVSPAQQSAPGAQPAADTGAALEPETAHSPETQKQPARNMSPEPVDAPPARRELPPEPLTSDEPPLEEIEEVWAQTKFVGDAVAGQSASDMPAPEIAATEHQPPEEQGGNEPKLELESEQTTEPAREIADTAMEAGDSMDDLPEDMSDSFYDDGDDDDDDDDLLVVDIVEDAGEPDDIVLDDDAWPEAVPEAEEVGAGDPYNELGMDGAGAADSDFSGFEFEETADEEKFDRGIDVDEFHDVINQVVSEVLASQSENDPESRGA